ncbi:MAG: aspartate aminotransferase family protein [Pseudomonadota bacterium]
MSDHVFPRSAVASMPKAVAASGCHITDANGKSYLDASGGAAVSALGHGHPRVIAAVKRQLDLMAYAHTGFFTSEPAEQLADMLVAKAPEGIDRVYFVSGGSEAVEAAIKLARQYQMEIGETDRYKIISRWQSYHGNTLGALAAGGNRWRRAQFAPLLANAFVHIDPCHHWRFGEAGESAFAYGQRVANALEETILAEGPQTVAAFMAEPVVGATMGAVPAVEGYFNRIREICDQYGVLLILDEVMCGMGRTGHWFASEADDVRPDIVCIAKALGAGVQPIGAMLCSAAIYDAIASGSGFFQHGHTYLGHASACAAGIAVLTEIEEADLLANVARQGAAIKNALGSALGQHPNIGDIRGRGLFIGLEFVADRETKDAFAPAMKLHAKLKSAAMKNGLMIYPMGGTIDGVRGDHVLLAPPYIMDDTGADELISKFVQTVDEVIPAAATV